MSKTAEFHDQTIRKCPKNILNWSRFGVDFEIGVDWTLLVRKWEWIVTSVEFEIVRWFQIFYVDVDKTDTTVDTVRLLEAKCNGAARWRDLTACIARLLCLGLSHWWSVQRQTTKRWRSRRRDSTQHWRRFSTISLTCRGKCRGKDEHVLDGGGDRFVSHICSLSNKTRNFSCLDNKWSVVRLYTFPWFNLNVLLSSFVAKKWWKSFCCTLSCPLSNKTRNFPCLDNKWSDLISTFCCPVLSRKTVENLKRWCISRHFYQLPSCEELY